MSNEIRRLSQAERYAAGPDANLDNYKPPREREPAEYDPSEFRFGCLSDAQRATLAAVSASIEALLVRKAVKSSEHPPLFGTCPSATIIDEYAPAAAEPSPPSWFPAWRNEQWERDHWQTFDRLMFLTGTNGAIGVSLAQLSEGMLLPARHIEQLVVYLLDRKRIQAVDHITPGYPPRYVPVPIAHGCTAAEISL